MEGDRYGRFLGRSTQDAADIEATTEGGEWTAEVLREAGFHPIQVIGERGPGLESRYSLVEDESGGHIEQRFVQPPQPPRTFSKIKIKGAIAEAGLLAEFKAMLEQVEVKPGYTAAEAFADAVTLDEDHPDFKDAVARAQRELGIPPEQVEAILSASVVP